MDFSGKVVFISGGSGSGVGSELSKSFAWKKAAVIVNGRSADQVNALCSEINGTGGIAYPAIADITDSGILRPILQGYLEKLGKIDIFVHNASTGSEDLLADETDDNTWFDEINTILSGAFYTVKAIIPAMKEQRYGKLIFVSSNAATTGSWGRNIGYAAAKAGLLGLSRRLALELAEYNVNVNAIIPSQIDTPRIRQNGRRDDAYIQNYISTIAPMGKIGIPQDVVNLVLFLASEQASYITGQQFILDGGVSFPGKRTKPSGLKK